MARYNESKELATLEAAQEFADSQEAPRWFGQEIWRKPNGAFVIVASFDCNPWYSQRLIFNERWQWACWRFNGQQWEYNERG